MRYYKRNKGLVVANSTFTRAAVQLAGTESDITLCDRRWLEEQVRTFLPPEVPEFNRERFDEIVKELCELTREIGSMRTGQHGRRRRSANEDYTFMGILTGFAVAKGKELTPAEIMDAAQYHAKIAKVEAELRELQENKEGRRAY
jgi:hypothetical protein